MLRCRSPGKKSLLGCQILFSFFLTFSLPCLKIVTDSNLFLNLPASLGRPYFSKPLGDSSHVEGDVFFHLGFAKKISLDVELSTSFLEALLLYIWPQRWDWEQLLQEEMAAIPDLTWGCAWLSWWSHGYEFKKKCQSFSKIKSYS